MLGEVKTPYWEHNPGSRDNMPKIDSRLLPVLTPDEAASAIVEGIDAKRPFVVKPALLRAFFVLNALFPRLVARQLRRALPKPSTARAATSVRSFCLRAHPPGATAASIRL